MSASIFSQYHFRAALKVSGIKYLSIKAVAIIKTAKMHSQSKIEKNLDLYGVIAAVTFLSKTMPPSCLYNKIFKKVFKYAAQKFT